MKCRFFTKIVNVCAVNDKEKVIDALFQRDSRSTQSAIYKIVHKFCAMILVSWKAYW